MAWLIRKVTGRSYSELFIFLGHSHPDPAAKDPASQKGLGAQTTRIVIANEHRTATALGDRHAQHALELIQKSCNENRLGGGVWLYLRTE